MMIATVLHIFSSLAFNVEDFSLRRKKGTRRENDSKGDFIFICTFEKTIS